MKRLWLIISLALLLSLGSIIVAMAQTGGGYDLAWSSIDGGSMFSTGGGYSLGGTIGQPDADRLSGGSYALVGAFWGGADIAYTIYLPLILK